jgi:large subunit ribosomal protein L9
MQIDKKWIELERPIKEIGLYDVKLRLPGGVKGTIKVEVIAEQKE